MLKITFICGKHASDGGGGGCHVTAAWKYVPDIHNLLS